MADIKNLGVNNTGGKCYIVELRPPYQKLEMQFIPASMKLTSTAQNAKIEVVGRNNPIHHYTGGDDKLVFKLDFYSDTEDRDDVIKKCRWIQALRYNNGSRGPKRNVKVVMGDMFQREIWIVDSVAIDLSTFDGTKGFRPRQATVDINLSLDPIKNLTIDDVRNL